MTIAVTGATGFIGQYVVAELDCHTINPILICLPGSEGSIGILNHKRVLIDIKNPPKASYDLIGQPDVLIHLAWSGLPNYKSLHHYEEELPVQYRFLKGLIESGLKNLLVAGTCFEYGMTSGLLNEDLVTSPNNPYGFAKDMLRRQLEYLQEIKFFNLTWARLFYMFGDGQSSTSIFSQLKKAIESRDKVFNLSGGEQLRDYLPVSEVARYIVALAINEKNNGIVNVCSGIPVSIRKLVEDWIDKYKWSIKLNFGYYPYSDFEPLAFWGDTKKLNKIISEDGLSNL